MGFELIFLQFKSWVSLL